MVFDAATDDELEPGDEGLSRSQVLARFGFAEPVVVPRGVWGVAMRAYQLRLREVGTREGIAHAVRMPVGGVICQRDQLTGEDCEVLVEHFRGQAVAALARYEEPAAAGEPDQGEAARQRALLDAAGSIASSMIYRQQFYRIRLGNTVADRVLPFEEEGRDETA